MVRPMSLSLHQISTLLLTLLGLAVFDISRVLSWFDPFHFLATRCATFASSWLPLTFHPSMPCTPRLDPHGQVVFVMAIFPLAMNILQFTLLDTILRHSSPPSSLPSSSTSTHPTAHSRDRSTAYASLPTSDTPRSPILTANLDAYSTSTSTPGSPRTALSPRPGGLLRQRSGSVCSADGERFNAGVGANGLGLHGVDGGEEEMRVGGGGVGGPEGKGKEE